MSTYVKKLKNYEKKFNIKKKGITITVSGLSGSGKSTIAETLAKKLKIKYKNMGDVFRELAKEKNISMEKFSKTRAKKTDILLDEKCLKLAKEGNILLNGRLTGWVAGDNAEIRVWIKCDLKTRAKRVAERENKTFQQAKRDITERDNVDKKRYKELYDIDAENTEIYNYIFDNGKATYEEAITKPSKDIKLLLDKMDTTSN